ncbi:MAG TPA: hypothetical protein VMR06_11560 [Dokdonella sp.]|nr:hypothetical protein [Dokdonella sp.]HUD42615.1 hypothetical protein [Dokdonella sp.]
MSRMPIVSVRADLETVAALEPQAAVDACQPDPSQRHGLIEQLHAGAMAQFARQAPRLLARAQRAQPQRDRGADEQQGNPLTEHRPSVETAGRPCKGARSDRRGRTAGGRSRRPAPFSLESPS